MSWPGHVPATCSLPFFLTLPLSFSSCLSLFFSGVYALLLSFGASYREGTRAENPRKRKGDCGISVRRAYVRARARVLRLACRASFLSFRPCASFFFSLRLARRDAPAALVIQRILYRCVVTTARVRCFRARARAIVFARRDLFCAETEPSEDAAAAAVFLDSDYLNIFTARKIQERIIATSRFFLLRISHLTSCRREISKILRQQKKSEAGPRADN